MNCGFWFIEHDWSESCSMIQKEDLEYTDYEMAKGCQDLKAPVTGATENHNDYMNLFKGVKNSDSASPFKNQQSGQECQTTQASSPLAFTSGI